MTRGSPSWLTGRDACSTQASALAVSGSGACGRRGGLKACPYKAARNLPGGGVRPVSRGTAERRAALGEQLYRFPYQAGADFIQRHEPVVDLGD